MLIPHRCDTSGHVLTADWQWVSLLHVLRLFLTNHDTYRCIFVQRHVDRYCAAVTRSASHGGDFSLILILIDACVCGSKWTGPDYSQVSLQ